MRWEVSTVALLVFSAAAGTASADPTAAACERLRAEAAAEADVLYAPRVLIEAARAPTVVDAGDPVGVTDGMQARASLAFSATDALRGRAIARVADAECARELAVDRAARVLAVGARHGELAATRAELAFLEQRLPDADAIVADSVERFAHQRATAVEVDDLRGKRGTIRVRIANARSDIGELEVMERGGPAVPQLGKLAKDIRTAELAVDRRHAELRTWSAWQLDVRAGAAAGERPDWFAVVSFGYSLGERAQARANARALAARERELASDDHAIPGQLDQLQRAMDRSVADLTGELATVTAEVDAQRAERDRVAALEGDAAKQLASRFSLELVDLEARQIFLTTLLAARRPLAGVSK